MTHRWNNRMRAIAFDAFGRPPTMLDLPSPQPRPGEVRVRVLASSINNFDLQVLHGHLRSDVEHRFPVILGRDFAGVVDAVGPGAASYAAGEPVFGVVARPYLGPGAFAEFVTVPATIGIASRPPRVSLAEAGALALAGTMAVQMVEALELRAEQTVLISGASGGVGSYLVQLAAARGARVIATFGSSRQADFLESLGAAETVYVGNLSDEVRKLAPRGVEAVAHLAGNAQKLARLVAPGGRFASALGVGPEQLAGRPLTVLRVTATPTTELLDALARAVARRRLVVPIAGTYPLAGVPRALAELCGTRKLGKVSIAI